MTYIITQPCVGLKDAACVDVCPVDCIYTREQDDQFYINPDECIDCAACEPVCPVTAIFSEDAVPADQQEFIAINYDYFKDKDLSDLSIETEEITNFPLISSKLSFSLEDFKNRENIACYAGTVYPYSNQENTIKAIKSIQKAKYKVAGYIDQDHLNSLRKEDFEDRINFMGRLNRDNLQNLLYSSVVGLCVYDYKKNLGYKLGSFATNKLFEYMEAGLPVICTDYEIWKEVVEGHNCGICIEPGNYNQLQEAIKYIFSNKDESYKMGQRGKKAINEKYNWRTEEDKYLSLVKKIL